MEAARDASEADRVLGHLEVEVLGEELVELAVECPHVEGGEEDVRELDDRVSVVDARLEHVELLEVDRVAELGRRHSPFCHNFVIDYSVKKGQ